jgi:hypothetical protein
MGILTGGNFGRRGPGFDVVAVMHTGGRRSPFRMMYGRRGDERQKGYGAVECGDGVGAFYRAGGEGTEAVGAGGRPTAINGTVSCGGGNGEGKRGVSEMKGVAFLRERGRCASRGAARRCGQRRKVAAQPLAGSGDFAEEGDEAGLGCSWAEWAA